MKTVALFITVLMSAAPAKLDDVVRAWASSRQADARCFASGRDDSQECKEAERLNEEFIETRLEYLDVCQRRHTKELCDHRLLDAIRKNEHP